jgi:hypothetical protein
MLFRLRRPDPTACSSAPTTHRCCATSWRCIVEHLVKILQQILWWFLLPLPMCPTLAMPTWPFTARRTHNRSSTVNLAFAAGRGQGCRRATMASRWLVNIANNCVSSLGSLNLYSVVKHIKDSSWKWTDWLRSWERKLQPPPQSDGCKNWLHRFSSFTSIELSTFLLELRRNFAGEETRQCSIKSSWLEDFGAAVIGSFSELVFAV